jgi:glycerol-3-phosphate dehydrogenase subunit C
MLRSVVYFSGCAANFTDPDVGRAAVAVLERNGLSVRFPEQRCCGMPQLGQGSLDAALDRARFNVRSLAKEHGDIVTACTTCALMLRQFYPRVLGTEEAGALSRRVYDLGEYLAHLQLGSTLDTGFRPVAGTYFYHAPCHLKALGEGLIEDRLRMLRQVPGISIVQLDRGCCGLGGSFGMARQNRNLSLQIGSGLFEALQRSPGSHALTECPGCKLQIEKEAGVTVVHPAQLLQQAYGL